MVKLLLVGLLACLLAYTIVLLKTYRRVSPSELKRKAREGDKMADSFYKVVGYGRSVDIILWFVIGASGGLLFAFLASTMALWLATIVLALLIWFSFAWLPNSHSTKIGRRLAQYSAPVLQALISGLYPVLVRVEKLIYSHTPIVFHTGLYSREDLLDLLSKQKGQLDNRISKEELAIAKNALVFGEKFVRDCMTPKRVIKMVDSNETVGPILMKELHTSGHSRYPVYEDKKDNLIGILYMRDMLDARAGGRVKNIMQKQVFYVHDESPLNDVLQAFIKTHHHLFVVVNSFEEIVGLITMEDVLEQIIGKPILDEFDQYDSLRAVAAKQAQKDHKENNEVVKTSPVATEVIE